MTRKRVFIAYLILLHLTLAGVLVKSDFLDRVRHRFSPPADELTPHYRRMFAYHMRMDGNLPDHSVIFIGDSITQGLAVSAVSAAAVNYGIGSDTTTGVLLRLPRYKSLQRAEWVVIAVGVNDLRRRGDSEIVENYRRILQALPAHIQVLVSAILPVDERLWGGPGSNRRIGAINQATASLCNEFDKVGFIDIGPDLVAPDGNLRTRFHTGDGIHLNTAGYGVWIAALRRTMLNPGSPAK